MGSKIAGTMGVLIFIILLGMIVHLMNLSGATHEYAQWASRKLKTKKHTLLATMALGIIIFVDDYFNCMTVGTVMRPVTDKNRISREKLAYIIDSTAAPICIIAPISSWAAAVSSSLPDGSAIDGFQLFLKTISCNYYSWFSIVMVLLIILFEVDFGKMKKCEEKAMKYGIEPEEDMEEAEQNHAKGKVFDLLLPVVALIILSLISMLYTGGFFNGGVSLSDAFANCDALAGLAMGALYTIVFVAFLYLPRKIVTGKQFLDSFVEGFKNMVPTVLILIFAWTLSGICGSNYLNVGGFVTAMVDQYSISMTVMPVIFFIIALFLACATGTSWGTFAILLPIIVTVFGDTLVPLTSITTAALLGGSVCGDHISPISDTTIMSSTGAGCDHISHVATQMQYAIVVAIVSAIGYVISGYTQTIGISYIVGIVILFAFIMVIKKKNQSK
jgi:Na+/H+ antiporter NhaC